MGFLPSSPLSLFGAPLLFVASLPLAILAAFTTSVAVSLLAIRVSVVYLELGVALVHASLFPEPAKPVIPSAARDLAFDVLAERRDPSLRSG